MASCVLLMTGGILHFDYPLYVFHVKSESYCR